RPLGMVVELLGHERRAAHEAEGLVEIFELECLRDGVAALNLAPAGELRERGLASIAGQLLTHGAPSFARRVADRPPRSHMVRRRSTTSTRTARSAKRERVERGKGHGPKDSRQPD